MKVFISHDSRDKNRFVKDFAIKLINQGIDVWYDEWELKLGDSLIDIFDAISQCDVFISVISENSIESEWVKEESDSAFIKKIEENIKFIPVILPGDFKIPSNMNHILQCRINDLNNYDEEFNSLISSIYDISIKPKIGSEPRYTLISPIAQLKKSDTLVIKSMGDFFQKNDMDSLSFDKILELTQDFDLTDKQVSDSIGILKELDYIYYLEIIDQNPVNIKFTYVGCMLYCKYYIDNYKGLLVNIFLAIINENIMESNLIVKETKIQEFIVDAVLKCLESKKCIEIIETFDGIIISKIFIKGKRYMKRFVEDGYGSKIGKLEFLLPKCNEKETIIFEDLCNYFLDRSFDDEMDPMTIMNRISKYYDEDNFDILQENIAYSLRNLEKNNYILTTGGSIGMAFSSISISQKGFCFYLKNFYKNPNVYLTIIEELNSNNNFIIKDVSEKYGIPDSITKNLIQIFRKSGYISCNNDLTDIEVTISGKEYFESEIS